MYINHVTPHRDLQRRGCVRTAFEFARLLLSLDPWEDPHGALFHLDFLALKAGMGSWLLEMYDLHASNNSSITKAGTQQQNGRLNPTVLPGWLYARALALRYDEESRKDKVGGLSFEFLFFHIYAYI